MAIHLGDNHWLLVDSCVNPDTRAPASLEYLEQLGVNEQHVRWIVASHWHDDHVRGLAKIVVTFPQAEFFLSNVFNDNEAKAFLAAYGSPTTYPLARGARELHTILKSHSNVTLAQNRVIVLEKAIQGRAMRVLAFSPTKEAQKQALMHMAGYIPRDSRDPMNHAPELKPNLEAVVLHVDFGDDAVLLGSDLENHGPLGWREICSDDICGNQRRATAFKIGHHGSKTAHLDAIWAQLLTEAPLAVLTPFNNGAVHLPEDDDKVRITKAAGAAYTTSDATRRPQMPAYQLKRMSDICRKLTRVNAGFGAVRLRKKLGAPTWLVELFGSAARLAA